MTGWSKTIYRSFQRDILACHHESASRKLHILPSTNYLMVVKCQWWKILLYNVSWLKMFPVAETLSIGILTILLKNSKNFFGKISKTLDEIVVPFCTY